MRRVLAAVVTLSWCVTASPHHWVVNDYDASDRVTIEVEVEEFRFIYPHPFIYGHVADLPDSLLKYKDKEDDLWAMEMDNRRELIALGFDEYTLEPGDRLTVTVDPSPFKKNTLYVRVFEHPADGYRYVHNHRKLYPIESAPVEPR